MMTGWEHWNYQELDDQNIRLDKETGNLPIIQAQVLLPLRSNVQAYVNYEYSFGTLKYDGATQTGVPHDTRTDTRSQCFEILLRYNLKQTYFNAGVLLQNWQRRIRANQGVSRLNEKYQWLGPELGIGHIFKPTNTLALDLSVTGAYLQGEMEIDLSEVRSTTWRTQNYGKPTIPLEKGVELASELSLIKQLTDRSKLLASFKQGYRAFPKSKEITATNGRNSITLHEPKSKNSFSILLIGYAYSF